jgi:hypothetical protein
MMVVRRADGHRVDVLLFLLEHDPVVGVLAGLLELLCRLVEPVLVHVAEGDDVLLAAALDARGAAAAGADARDVQLRVRALLLRPHGLASRDPEAEAARGGRAAVLQEVATIGLARHLRSPSIGSPAESQSFLHASRTAARHSFTSAIGFFSFSSYSTARMPENLTSLRALRTPTMSASPLPRCSVWRRRSPEVDVVDPGRAP